MTLKELYAMCENLNQDTLFTIRAGYLEKPVEIDARYIELASFWDMPIKGFRIIDRRSCDIYT